MLFCNVSRNKNLLRPTGLPGVVRVIPNRIYHLHTTRSWDFLQVNNEFVGGILLKGRYGSNSTIGVLDSGVYTCLPTSWQMLGMFV